MSRGIVFRRLLFLFGLLSLPAVIECWQGSAVCPQAKTPSFEAGVNVVLVPVSVRDGRGKTVENLAKENFEIFDNDRRQTITGFSVEKRKPSVTGTEAGQSNSAAAAASAAGRFVVFLFDDLHLSADDLSQVQRAGSKMLAESFSSSDTGAVFSISGQTNSGFTHDRAKLAEAMLSVREQTMYRPAGQPCPNLSFYQADSILNRNSSQYMDAAVKETMNCTDLKENQAKGRVRAAAEQVLAMGNQSSQITLKMIRFVVEKMGTLPGERVLILISPGFLVPDESAEKSEVIDAAARSNVTISTLDARGLYVTAMKANQSMANLGSPDLVNMKNRSISDSMAADDEVLADLADGTGGAYFHSSNDLQEGFSKLSQAPECLYLLEFRPTDSKRDGSFHRLKVKVNKDGLKVQARRGYFAADADKKHKVKASS